MVMWSLAQVCIIPFEKIATDLVRLFPKSRGAIDMFSRWLIISVNSARPN